MLSIRGEGEEDQRRLRDAAKKWAKTGAHVLVNNAGTSRIRFLYRGCSITRIIAPRHINCNGNGRGPAAEVIIRG